MLVLSRKVGERIVIGGSVVVTVIATQGKTVKIGIEAPPGVSIFREELVGQPGNAASTEQGRSVGAQPNFRGPVWNER